MRKTEDNYLGASAVRQRYGNCSDMTLWRWLADEDLGFPQPLRIQRRRFWRLSDLQRWEARCGRNPEAAKENGLQQRQLCSPKIRSIQSNRWRELYLFSRSSAMFLRAPSKPQRFPMAHRCFATDALPHEVRIAAEILSHPVSLLLCKSTIDILDRIADRRLPRLSAIEARVLRLCSAAVMFAEQVPREIEDPRLAVEFATLLEVMP